MANNPADTNNSAIDPWMSELSAWADVFDISANTMPQAKSERLDKERRWLDSIAVSTLYALEKDNYSLTEFAFFIVSDDWDQQSLISLKDKTGALLLIGLQTTNYCIGNFDVADSVIRCKPDEVQQVMKVFEVLSNRRNDLVNIDFNVIKETLQHTEPAQFIQSIKMGRDRLDRVEQAITEILSQIPENISINFLILRIKADSELSLDEFSVIESAIYNQFDDNISFWCAPIRIDEPDCCWIEGIYGVA